MLIPPLDVMQGWIIVRDTTSLIESARLVATRLKWDARVVGLDTSTDEKLLVCQKPFFKQQQQQ
jgi:putative pectin methyltransferase